MFDRHSERAYKVYGALTRLEQMASMNEGVYRKENNIAGLQDQPRTGDAADQLRMKQGSMTGNPCEGRSRLTRRKRRRSVLSRLPSFPAISI